MNAFEVVSELPLHVVYVIANTLPARPIYVNIAEGEGSYIMNLSVIHNVKIYRKLQL